MKSAGTKDYHENDVAIPNTSGKGIKLGSYSEATPLFGWRDITSEINVRGVGATDPTWSQIGSGPFFAYDFAVNDVCWMSFHIPHDIVPNSTINLHAHWLSDGTETNSVKWEFIYAYAKGFDQAAFDMAAGTTVTAEEAASGTAFQHMVTETTSQTISGLDEPDGIVYTRIRRITNGATDNTDSIFLLTSDIHYQSTNIATRQKSPNFYAD